MAKNIRKIIKKLPKKRQQTIEARVQALIEEETTLSKITQRAQKELGKLGLDAEQLKLAVKQRSEKR